MVDWPLTSIDRKLKKNQTGQCKKVWINAQEYLSCDSHTESVTVNERDAILLMCSENLLSTPSYLNYGLFKSN